MKIISVSQLNAYIKDKLESDMVLGNIWIRGEVSNFKHHSSGHMYLTLKDKAGSVRSVIFRSRAAYLKFLPQDGMSVVARGRVTVYERDGQYQLYIDEMEPDGVGALYTAYLQLKDRLEQEGLFDRIRKRPLPSFPKKIGVVTSPTGAAVRDIITVVKRRSPNLHIIIIPVAVQGENAPAHIAKGIKTANSLRGIDVLIVGRGGGSIEELWAFNSEIVARSIYESTIPVVSAVGHETDFTIADFVADHRAPTPSAAAEIVVPDFRELEKHINSLNIRLVTGIKTNIHRLKDRVERTVSARLLRKPKDEIYKKMQHLDFLSKRLGQAITTGFAGKKAEFAVLVSRLETLNPLTTLKRGYTICTDSAGNIINKVAGVKEGDNLNIRMTDGSLKCAIDKVEEDIYGEKKD